MQQIQLFQVQQIWLDQVNKAEKLNISMVADVKKLYISSCFLLLRFTLLERALLSVKKIGYSLIQVTVSKINAPKNIPCC